MMKMILKRRMMMLPCFNNLWLQHRALRMQTERVNLPELMVMLELLSQRRKLSNSLMMMRGLSDWTKLQRLSNLRYEGSGSKRRKSTSPTIKYSELSKSSQYPKMRRMKTMMITITMRIAWARNRRTLLRLSMKRCSALSRSISAYSRMWWFTLTTKTSYWRKLVPILIIEWVCLLTNA